MKIRIKKLTPRPVYLPKINSEFMWLLAYGVYLFYGVIGHSTFSSMLPGAVLALMKAVALALSLGSLLLKRRYKYFWVGFVAVSVLVGFYIFKANDQSSKFLTNIILIFTAYKIDLHKILKVNFVTVFSTWVLVTASAVVGIIPSRAYIHDAVVANTVGFNYYSFPNEIIGTCSMSYLVLKKKVSWLELAVLWLANFAAYKVYSAKMSLIVISAMILWYILVCKIRWMDFRAKLFKVVSVCGYSFFAVATLVLYGSFDPSNKVWQMLDEAVTGRLTLGNLGMQVYKIGLFGNSIDMQGNADRVYGIVNETSNYIDSGFLYSFLGYGVIFTVLLIVCYSSAMLYLYRSGEAAMWGWAAIFMFFCMFNNYMTSLTNNPVILIGVTSLFCPVMIRLKQIDKDTVLLLLKRGMIRDKIK